MIDRFMRRSRLEVMYQIISLCLTSQQKTGIMYKCNLSYEQLQKYLGFLVDSNLLEILRREDGKEYYQATAYGEKFVSEYEKLKNIIEEAKRGKIKVRIQKGAERLYDSGLTLNAKSKI